MNGAGLKARIEELELMQAGSHYERSAHSTVATRQWWEGGLYENASARAGLTRSDRPATGLRGNRGPSGRRVHRPAAHPPAHPGSYSRAKATDTRAFTVI
jgi:hypothetical protein